MKVFLGAGLLYLVGIAVVLMVKPEFMFREDGSWKEFGIGRDSNTHTILPLWLFCIFWALISYISVVVIFRVIGLSGTTGTVVKEEVIPTPRKPAKAHRGSKLPEGYYVLNKSENGGPPTYVYLGEDVTGGTD
jgi:hypothetical protein